MDFTPLELILMSVVSFLYFETVRLNKIIFRISDKYQELSGLFREVTGDALTLKRGRDKSRPRNMSSEHGEVEEKAKSKMEGNDLR